MSAEELHYSYFFEDITGEDVAGLHEAQKHYGDSWIRRGGVGAFMMLARKWDRLENKVSNPDPNVDRYDIIQAAVNDPRSEGIIDDIRDLRRYLLLVEAKIRSEGVNPQHRDNE